MRIAENWKDYKIIDTSNGDKLESWGGRLLVRPDPQIIWRTEHKTDLWDKADAVYHTVTDEVTPQVPATILKTHPSWRLFLDKASAAKLPA